METTKNNVFTELGVIGVPASAACYARPWLGHAVGVVSIAPKASLRLEQNSAPQKSDPMTPAVDATPRKDANPFSTVARSGIRTQGPPV